MANFFKVESTWFRYSEEIIQLTQNYSFYDQGGKGALVLGNKMMSLQSINLSNKHVGTYILAAQRNLSQVCMQIKIYDNSKIFFLFFGHCVPLAHFYFLIQIHALNQSVTIFWKWPNKSTITIKLQDHRTISLSN